MRKPRPSVPATPQLRERFERYTRKLENGCWEWVGSRNPQGYGQFCVDQHPYRAHRIAYEWATGQHPGELFVCHSCDNPSCVNPSHLWLGTPQDNSEDRERKGRGVRILGTANGAAKLTPEIVRELRQSKRGHAAEARRLGVSKRAVVFVRQRITWGHVQ